MLKIHCVSCNKSMSVPEKYAGHKGKCPSCGAVNKIPPTDKGPLPESANTVGGLTDNHEASDISSNQTRPCPMCGENILISEKKCEHCGEFLLPQNSNASIGSVGRREHWSGQKGNSYFNDFFEFRRMLTPRILKTSFIIVLIINAFSALYYIIKGQDPNNM
ncbi:MAG: hypothetical protein DRP56_07455, partial [Planctomycetota bacterium]